MAVDNSKRVRRTNASDRDEKLCLLVVGGVRDSISIVFSVVGVCSNNRYSQLAVWHTP